MYVLMYHFGSFRFGCLSRALRVLCVCSVCVLLLSGLPGQEAKLNIKPTNQQKIYRNMQRKASILGPNIVDFGTHFDISSFPGPNMQHTLILRPANDRLFTQKWSPKWTQNLVKWVSIFSTFLMLFWNPVFNDFVSQTVPKWYPKMCLF